MQDLFREPTDAELKAIEDDPALMEEIRLLDGPQANAPFGNYQDFVRNINTQILERFGHGKTKPD